MSLRNILPIVIAVVTGVGISTYTLKPGLEEQKRLRESKEGLPETFRPSETRNNEAQPPNQTMREPGTDSNGSSRST
ncbi:hypothetical protein CDEST_06342 [Colletotrichum destructivum]|uniref:Uncharacterized protein n=1 Tax=Colletotrichum destructivum TaxID=34406 RepID=A0AAX4IEE3_9PEZI|nr:hypothetical protein CDEST_06342 [Colletotrichum destructivum]